MSEAFPSDMKESSTAEWTVKEQENTKLAMWVFLGGEVIFFSTLILTYVFVRLKLSGQYASFLSHLNVPLVGVNTFVLITSSYFVVRSLEAIRRGNQKGLRNNLLAVIALGALFLIGQAYEWIVLFGEGISIKNTFGTYFFTITGIHGTHVFVGLIWAVIVILSARRGAYSRNNFLGVENFGLYWHFVDIVWIILFNLFYLI